jgi:hypothetical protein
MALLAHGGVAGAIVEALVVIALVAVLAAAWLGTRRGGRDR